MRYFLDQSIEAKWKVRCSIWPTTISHVEERWRVLMRVINGEVCGSAILEKKMEFLEIQNSFGFMKKERKIEKRKKEKKLKLKGYFL